MFNNYSEILQSRFGYCVCLCRCSRKGTAMEQAALIKIDVGEKSCSVSLLLLSL